MQMLSNRQIESFKDFLSAHEFFFIIGHKEPDGDCIYSCLGMASLVDKLHKPYQLLSAGPFKRPEIRDQQSQFTDTPHFLSQPERNETGLIILDCSEFLRLGEIDGDLNKLDTFIIDHHKTADSKDIPSIIEPTAPATACLVQQLYEQIIGQPDKKTAEYFFFGMATDTGYFRFLNENSAEVFKAAARLVEAGVSPRTTYDQITGGKSYLTRKLLGIMLDRAERYYNNKLVVTYETMEDTRKYGTEGRDSDSLYSLLLSVEGIEAVVFIRQETENSCTAGLRSKDSIDVSSIAAHFGGGGHKNAAGLSIEGRIETLLPSICKEFAKIF